MVAVEPGVDAGLRPAQERVLEQADRVVGDRPAHRVLEVEHGRAVGSGAVDSGAVSSLACNRHQVARHVVAVHQHLRLRERAVDQAAVDEVELLQVAAVQRQAEVAAEVPLVEQAQLAREQRLVVGRQVVGARDRLQLATAG